MSRPGGWGPKKNGVRTVYVGNLPDDIRHVDMQYLFDGFGQIQDIDIKRGPGINAYAFLDFCRARDAADAVHRRDGYDFEGERLRVELKGGSGGPAGPPAGAGNTMRNGRRVVVTGLPSSARWQDLKDHMRRCGDVGYCEVERQGTAVVRYNSPSGVRAAVEQLDGSMFCDSSGKSEIRVEAADPDLEEARSRSRSIRARRG